MCSHCTVGMHSNPISCPQLAENLLSWLVHQTYLLSKPVAGQEHSANSQGVCDRRAEVASGAMPMQATSASAIPPVVEPVPCGITSTFQLGPCLRSPLDVVIYNPSVRGFIPVEGCGKTYGGYGDPVLRVDSSDGYQLEEFPTSSGRLQLCLPYGAAI